MNDFTICCRNCGWHWKSSQSESADMYICHKCGFDNKFRNSQNNFKNIVQQIDLSNQSVDGLIYGGSSPSSVIPYTFSQYLIVKDYSIMSCDALKAYSYELYNVDTSLWSDYRAISDLNTLRSAVDLMINSKCANVKTTTCGVGTWSIYPALPSGLSINVNTGAISGKASKPYTGTYTITFTPIIGSPISTKWTLNILSFDLSSLQ